MRVLRGRSDRQYRLGSERRSGGQAWVYRAQDPSGREVAVKLAKDDGEHSDRLNRERDELERLKRDYPDVLPWVVEILDHGLDDDGRSFLVLPWYDHNLMTWIEGRSLEEKLWGLERACGAVARLHNSERSRARGVVHRDIKPWNFLVAGEGEALEVVLADFGGVRRGLLSSETTLGGVMTVGFAPPEQLLHRKVPPEQNWDVYALGITLYACLVGRTPLGTDAAVGRLTPEGQELRSLADQFSRFGTSRPELQARFEDLCRLPVPRLVDLEQIHPLTERDRQELSDALCREVRGAVEDPIGVGRGLAEELLERLELALHPDPQEREGDARRLRSACREMRRMLRTARERSRPAPAAPGWVDPGSVPAFDTARAATPNLHQPAGPPRAGPDPPAAPASAAAPAAVMPPALSVAAPGALGASAAAPVTPTRPAARPSVGGDRGWGERGIASLYAVAWLLPVFGEQAAFPAEVPGWGAFTSALSPLWELGEWEDGWWLRNTTSILSALTNFVFLAALLARTKRFHGARRVAGWGLLASFGINAYWFTWGVLLANSGDELPLRIGHYLWWSSFLMMSVSLLRRTAGGAR